MKFFTLTGLLFATRYSLLISAGELEIIEPRSDQNDKPPIPYSRRSPVAGHHDVPSQLLSRETDMNQAANVWVAGYSTRNCQSASIELNVTVTYDTQNPVTETGEAILSFYISRALSQSEQIDWSVYTQSMQGSAFKSKRTEINGVPEACVLWTSSFNAPFAEGCTQLNTPASCFRMWKH